MAWLAEITGVQFYKGNFANKNAFMLCNTGADGSTVEVYQVEFISETAEYYYTILFTGVGVSVNCNLHNRLVNYVKELNLDRTVAVDTDYKPDLCFSLGN